MFSMNPWELGVRRKIIPFKYAGMHETGLPIPGSVITITPTQIL